MTEDPAATTTTKDSSKTSAIGSSNATGGPSTSKTPTNTAEEDDVFVDHQPQPRNIGGVPVASRENVQREPLTPEAEIQRFMEIFQYGLNKPIEERWAYCLNITDEEWERRMNMTEEELFFKQLESEELFRKVCYLPYIVTCHD